MREFFVVGVLFYSVYVPLQTGFTVPLRVLVPFLFKCAPQKIGSRELSFWAREIWQSFLKRKFNLLSKTVWHIPVAQKLTKCQPTFWGVLRRPLIPSEESEVHLKKSAGIWSIFELHRCVIQFWKGYWISFSKMIDTSLQLKNWVRGSQFSLAKFAGRLHKSCFF